MCKNPPETGQMNIHKSSVKLANVVKCFWCTLITY